MRSIIVVFLAFAIIVVGGAWLLDLGQDVPRLGEATSVFWLDVDEDLEEAPTTFERGDVMLAIEQLTCVAQGFLGSLFTDGFGVAKDHCRGLEWFKRAAGNGNAQAK
jgi:TPR repeat protein